jgi:biopolymer transport protein ExbB
MSADILVQVVMVGLAIASLLTWAVWLAKTIEVQWSSVDCECTRRPLPSSDLSLTDDGAFFYLSFEHEFTR